MRERSGLVRAGFVVALMLAMVACGDEADEAEDAARDVATTVASALENATRLKATLTGTAEVPGPGDPDGTGTASVNIDASKRELCYEVSVQRIDRPTGMHIHEGESGKAGDIVVPLTTPAAGDTTTTGCTNIDAALMGRITATPQRFYLNVHSETHPQGAVRGQLAQ
jgi:hypothetical protein